MSITKSKRSNVRLAIESLEARALPAGDVTVSVVAGSLIIEGDALDNRLTIDQTGLASGQFRVTGESFTYINGDTAPLVVSGITRDLVISLGDENDKLIIIGADIPRDLAIATGNGNDTVLLSQTAIGRHLEIATTAGDDIVNLVDIQVRHKTAVFTGAGNDVATLEGSEFRGKTVVSTAAGNDTILLQDSTFHKQEIDPGSGNNQVIDKAIDASFDFTQGAQGWKAGFADYNPEHHLIDAQSGIRDLPPELGSGTGYYISGRNVADDLFMFLNRRLGTKQGIEPNRLYQLRFTVVFGSNVPTGCFGIGGSPGESVFLKAGASTTQPKPVLADDGHLRMNVDKGNQATGGPAGSIIGGIGNGISCDDAVPPPDGGELPPDDGGVLTPLHDSDLEHDEPEEPGLAYVSLERHHIHDFLVRSDAKGNLWLLVGTDSGYEGATSLFYQRIDVKLIPVQEGSKSDQVAPPGTRTTHAATTSPQRSQELSGESFQSLWTSTIAPEHFASRAGDIRLSPEQTPVTNARRTSLQLAPFTLESLTPPEKAKEPKLTVSIE